MSTLSQCFNVSIRISGPEFSGHYGSKLKKDLEFSLRKYGEEFPDSALKSDLGGTLKAEVLEATPYDLTAKAVGHRKKFGPLSKLEVAADGMSVDEARFQSSSNTIRTSRNHIIATFDQHWIINADGAIPEDTLVYFTLATKHHRAHWDSDGNALIEAAKAVRDRMS